MEDELESTAVTQPDTKTDGASAGQAEQTGEQKAAPAETMLDAITKVTKGPDANTKPAEETAGQVRDSQGRFASKTQEAAAADTAAEAAAKVGAEKPEGQPQDDLTTMPEGLSDKAQRRFRNLVGKVHETTAELTATREQLGQFQSVVRDTGANAQEFGMALEYLRAMKSGNLEDALRMVDDQRRMISLALGRSLQNTDPLAQYPDLRQRVDAYQMDEAAAMEIARARHMAQQQQVQRQTETQTAQRAVDHETNRMAAVRQIDQLGVQWGRTDPDYAHKEKIIMAQLPAIAQQFPPQLWPQQVAMLYQTLSALPAQPAPSARSPAPLRASGQTAGARAPTSMLEAISGGLGYTSN